ncbi:MuDRA-like transposase [Cucumis melo var. makuwa]|uniref:MuDRA-like transposase n=1 Tax=Cucumis melo var. makuwa TaxID=1194695 RepID=A0A5A7UA00_CUCMM|nr:MuDRA-like transposase [Cucumis melo var. makuwa]
MAHVRILVRHGGEWDEGQRKYEGGVLKGIVVPKEITHKDLQSELYDLAEVDPTKFDIKIRCIYEIKGEKEAPPFELSNDRDLKFYILSENPLEVPLYLSFEATSNRSMKVLNKDYNSVSGSNQVQNLNPHPSPIGMDRLDENEVDIGEVQVGLCDYMIGTNSAIWESYESYHSIDDTFTWELVEMYNELFDIQEQRDAPTKDCKGKGKVDYNSFSRKLKTKRSVWSEESSTSEELDNQTENQGNDHTDQNDNEYVVQEQHTEHQEETQREHQEECGSDISIDGRDADLLMTIRDISDSLSHQIQKETDLPQMITTLPFVSQPLALCELAPLDQTVQIVNEESQLLGINKPDCIVWNHIFDTHLVTPDNTKAEWTDLTTHLTIWTEKDVEYYFNTSVGDYNHIPGWGDVNYVITCINIKEHWLAIPADMRKCRIYVFDSMPNYVEQKLVDEALQMPARCIPSLAIAIGVNLNSDHFTYGPWPIRRSKATLQKGRSLDCGIFCAKFVECLVTASDLGCLTVPNMKLFRQQYVLELWANKYFC